MKMLDSEIQRLGNRLDLYFDFVRSKYTACVYKNTKNKVCVYYSEFQGKKITYDDMDNYKDYHDNLDVLVGSSVNNLTNGILEDSELFNIICEVRYIPELKGVSFVTAGYLLGQKCMEAVYGDKKYDSVQYIIANTTKTVSGDAMIKIAQRYLAKDIEDSSTLGYYYYNITHQLKNSEGKPVKVARNNIKRFGFENNSVSLSRIMRNFTDFIPIGYSWVSYTPFWFTVPSFVEKISKYTVLGCDWIEVPNLTINGYDIKDGDTVTYYTTKRRLYELLGEQFDDFNYRFTNNVIASLFLGNDGYTNASKFAFNNSNKMDMITALKYNALSDKDKESYSLIEDERAPMLAASYLIMLYWESMKNAKGSESNELKSRLSIINLDRVRFDVVQAEENSRELFNYVTGE